MIEASCCENPNLEQFEKVEKAITYKCANCGTYFTEDEEE
tara:strand:- start:3939 stop:4058 length:120 start_codon:yes stop_codon:yes gene_type:complete